MQKIIKKIEKTEYKMVKTGEYVEKDYYVASDGCEFEKQSDCERHEKYLKAIADGSDQFEDISIDTDLEHFILKVIFDANEYSQISILKWTVNKNKNNEALEYLKVKGFNRYFNLNLKEISNYNDGDVVLVASWTEYEHSDYPNHYSSSIKYGEITNKITDINNRLKLIGL